MLDIFSGLRLVVKRRNISIDNAIFRCHWFFTSTLLVSFSLIITARQYVGQPIECHSVDKIPESLLNSFCWVQSTFSIPQACNQKVGIDVPYPCIDNTRGRDIRVFAYYQWVGIALFIQGLLFHLPYYLWKVWENGLIRAITGGLRVAVLSDQERAKKKDIVISYIIDHLGTHKSYALKYFLCEFICLINLMIQLWATNKFFDGQFLRYGLDVMQYSSSSISSQFGLDSSTSSHKQSLSNQAENSETLFQNSSNPHSLTSSNAVPVLSKVSSTQEAQQIDPMLFIFPRMTKCQYFDFGSSGDVQRHDALCLLPLNIINQNIYIALWFWFLILALLTLLVIFYRLLAMVSESVRCKGLISRCKLSSENDIRIICRHCDVGDWFLFYMVAENVDTLIMREIIASIATKIRAHFNLKGELGLMFDPIKDGDQDSCYKFKTDDIDHQAYIDALMSNSDAASDAVSRYPQLPHYWTQQVSESLASSRRNSVANAASSGGDSGLALVKKIKKRLYNKRLWSLDLGSGELRQQLFGAEGSSNSEDGGCRANQSSSNYVQVSAPPASEMPLNSAPLLHQRSISSTTTPPNSPLANRPNLLTRRKWQRRGSLTQIGLGQNRSRGDSGNGSIGDSFIMEMSTISGSQSGPKT